VAIPEYLVVRFTVFHQELFRFSTAQVLDLSGELVGSCSKKLSIEIGIIALGLIKEAFAAKSAVESQGTAGTKVLGHGRDPIFSATDAIADLTGPLLEAE
jgi:hypothetical protein